MTKIKINQAKCVGCGVMLQSTHVHDYRAHSCTDLKIKKSYYFSVDGGKDYIRRGWGGKGLSEKPSDHYIEMSVYE